MKKPVNEMTYEEIIAEIDEIDNQVESEQGGAFYKKDDNVKRRDQLLEQKALAALEAEGETAEKKEKDEYFKNANEKIKEVFNEWKDTVPNLVLATEAQGAYFKLLNARTLDYDEEKIKEHLQSRYDEMVAAQGQKSDKLPNTADAGGVSPSLTDTENKDMEATAKALADPTSEFIPFTEEDEMAPFWVQYADDSEEAEAEVESK